MQIDVFDSKIRDVNTLDKLCRNPWGIFVKSLRQEQPGQHTALNTVHRTRVLEVLCSAQVIYQCVSVLA